MAPPLAVFKALADPSRLRLLEALKVASFNVGELCEILQMGQSRVSRHLKILAEAGLLAARRHGSWVFYALPPERNRPDLRTRVLGALAEEPASHEEDRRRALEILELRDSRTDAFFAEVAPRWDSLRRESLGTPDYLPDFLAGIPSGAVLVDLGTGTGEIALSVAERVERAIGVDRSQSMLAEAKRRRDVAGADNVEFRLGTLEHLPLRDHEADVAVGHMVLHYVSDPAMVLQEVRRSLRDGGALHLADLASHDQEWMRDELQHRWLGFDPDDLAADLEAADFHDVTLRTLERPGDTPDVVLATGHC